MTRPQICIAARIAAAYAIAASLWILSSDRLLSLAVRDPELLTRFQTFKGWLFVALTATLLYWLVNRHIAVIEGAEERLRERNEELCMVEEELRQQLDEYERSQHELTASGEKILRLNAELEERVRERTTELERANRELESFSYSVSHDLRAPLRHMDGFSKALLEDYGDRLDAEARNHLVRIRAGAQRMGRLIDDLLQLADVGRGQLERRPVNLSALAQLIAAELRQGEPEREVTFRIAEGVRAEGDSRLLRVALENLLGNAWKYTGKRAGAVIEFGAEEDEGERVYLVRDNGVGFDMAYAGKLFQPFQRLHRAEEFEGTGIGLATVRRVVERHGGRIWAEGTVGLGASFCFTLGR
ncbi:ATP-binding protein [Geobacter sp.]|uniref:sensor histidine kinase n=1 Tax=Geobacter sp. TaxID=46610 RepID=UPI002638827C|nr:ATP-binding protein [Geobacter sp.]